MISLQQIRRFFVIMILALMLAITIGFDFRTTNGWAIASPIEIATMNQVKALNKNIEGKTQETLGKITGDPKDQMMGKAKQVEGQVRNTAEDVKDAMKLKGRTKAVTKNIEGKVQEARGKVTDNRSDQVAGQAKQAESEARNLGEDLKEAVQNIFNKDT